MLTHAVGYVSSTKAYWAILCYFPQVLPKAGKTLAACGELLLVLNMKLETDSIADLEQDVEFRDLYEALNRDSPSVVRLPGLLDFRVSIMSSRHLLLSVLMPFIKICY